MSTKQEHIAKRLEAYQEFSRGTLRHEDLLPALGEALLAVAIGPDIKVAEAAKECGDLELDECDACELDYLLNEVIDTLQEYAPPYCYVGAHESDGSLFGVWPSLDCLDDEIACGEVLSVSNSSEIPDYWQGYVAIINERGNVEFGNHVEGEFLPIWASV